MHLLFNKIRNDIRFKLKNYKAIAIWGAGGFGKKALTQWLTNTENIRVVVDNKKYRGLGFLGYSVISPSKFLEEEFDCVIICVSAYKEVFKYLKDNQYGGTYYYILDLLNYDQNQNELDKLAIDLLIQKNTGWFETFLLKPQVLVNVTYRISRFLRKKSLLYPLSYPIRLIHSLLTAFFSIHIPDTVEAGPGLFFVHYGGIVIHPNANLGAFCTIYQGVTIGSNYSGQIPSIGAFVTFYSGSMVLGSSYLPDYTTIGANSVVIDTKCDQPYKTLVGTPARIL